MNVYKVYYATVRNDFSKDQYMTVIAANRVDAYEKALNRTVVATKIGMVEQGLITNVIQPPAPMLDLLPATVATDTSEAPKTSQIRISSMAQVRWNKNGDFSAGYYNIADACKMPSGTVYFRIETGYGVVYRTAEHLNFKDADTERIAA